MLIMEYTTEEYRKQVEREQNANLANDIGQECAGAADAIACKCYFQVLGGEAADAIKLARGILESLAVIAQKAAAVASAEADAIPESFGELKRKANISKDAAINIAEQCAEELEEFNHEHHE